MSSVASLYNDRVTTPYFEIHYTDSPYTVKSHGPKASWYSWDTSAVNPSWDSGNVKWTSNLPIVKFFSGRSLPSELSSEVESSRQFGVHYTGRFHVQSASASFFLMGNGNASVQMTGHSASGRLNLTTNDKQTYNLTGMTPGNYCTLDIHYWSLPRKVDSNNVFVVTWKDNTLPKALPLSAGYYYDTADISNGANAVGTFQISHILDTSLNMTKKQATEFSFSIPVVASALASIGYKYIESGDYFEDVTDNSNKIKRYRTVEYHTGFEYGAASLSTLTRFVGQIKNWKFSKNNKGKSVAIINCHDWTSFLNESINKGNPNIADYLSAHYLSIKTSEGAVSYSKPRTYDAWSLDNAVDNILINSGIDPKNLVQRKKHTDTTGTIVEGRYLSFERNTNYPIYLDRQSNYGKLIAGNDGADDKYTWQSSIGEQLLTSLDKVLSNYGLAYGFNNDGNFYTESVGNPIQIKSIDDVTFTGSWTEDTDVKSLYAVSKYSSTNADSVVATFVGAAVEIIFVRETNTGTVHIRLTNPTLGILATTNYHLNYTKRWNYHDGVDDSVGYNPCILKIGENLAYGNYSLYIEKLDTNKTNLNAINIYDKDFSSASATFNTGGGSAVLIDNYNIDTARDNLRNDVTVVGRLKGTKTSMSLDEDQEVPVNPQNPVAEHIVARAVDRASIGSMSASNYVGRQLPMIIIEPEIATEGRAEWLAIETVQRYNELSKTLTPQIRTVGNPLLQIGDMVHVKDMNLNVLSTMTDYYITKLTEQHTKGKYTTDISLDASKPWESYYRYPVPSLSRFDNTVFQNINLYNTGFSPMSSKKELPVYTHSNSSYPGTIAVNIRTSYQLETTGTNILNRIPARGYIKLGTDLIRYQNRSLLQHYYGNYLQEDRIQFTDLTRGCYSSSTIASEGDQVALGGSPIDLCVSPYGSEEFGIEPAIEFDLLVSGFVRVEARDANSGVLVETLTEENVNSSGGGWVYLEPGTYYYSWSMLDRRGEYNKTNSGYFQHAGTTQDVPGANVDTLGDWKNMRDRETGGILTIGKDFYVENKYRSQEGNFNFVLKFRDPRSEFFTSVQTTEINEKINTAKRWGITEFCQIIYDSTLDHALNYSTKSFSTLWWGYDSTGAIATIEIPDPLIISTDYKNHRKFYTGEENGGDGVLLLLNHLFGVSRIAKIEIKRQVFTLVSRTYEDRGQIKTHTYPIDKNLVEDLQIGDGFNFLIDNDNMCKIWISSPNSLSYVTDKIRADIQKHISNPYPALNYKLLNYVMTQVHYFYVKVIDMSGRNSVYPFWLYWIDPAYLNTQADLSGTPKQTPYGGPESKTYYLQASSFLFDPMKSYINYGEVLSKMHGYDTYFGPFHHTSVDVIHFNRLLGIMIYGEKI